MSEPHESLYAKGCTCPPDEPCSCAAVLTLASANQLATDQTYTARNAAWWMSEAPAVYIAEVYLDHPGQRSPAVVHLLHAGQNRIQLPHGLISICPTRDIRVRQGNLDVCADEDCLHLPGGATWTLFVLENNGTDYLAVFLSHEQVATFALAPVEPTIDEIRCVHCDHHLHGKECYCGCTSQALV